MSSRTRAKVPVIDFSNQNLKPSSPEWDLLKFQVREALEEYSCFEASFDQLLELRQPVLEALEQLFDLPSQTKQLCVSDKPFRAYFGPPSRLYESMSTDDAHSVENIEQCLTTTLWPQGNISFSKTLASFTQLASGLEKTILRMILESFGLEKYMDELVDSTNNHLRAMKYGRTNTSEPTLGVPAHCDHTTMTLLCQLNEVQGLEIQNKTGEWININPSPNSFVVMLGESFSVWLNGRLPSAYHRVMMKGNETRYSIGLFARPRGGYLVKVPKELVDDKNPMLFKPFDLEEFLKIYSPQAVQGATKSTLKAYCSV
ncbi:putative 2-oxoglutarate-dependent dioxygenase AOP1 [Gossypium australe]|uniref:Putative 2-oxoglutarate-dependent dioxygenase AOP1 n=1 Tax=Gossypium australe TaxID=47621 RepID=A0A5B6VV95_9ROSI|nr:putative 2-oxoglutarate-dependent dioxygenase AOP1 [Gossypium australe]